MRCGVAGIVSLVVAVSACAGAQRPWRADDLPDRVTPGGPDEVRVVAATWGRTPQPLGVRAAQTQVDDDAAVDADAREPHRALQLQRPLTINAKMSARCRQVRPRIERAATDAGLDPYLLLALAWVESGFDPGVESPAGAVGVMQMVPSTAAAFGCSTPSDVRCEARAAVSHLQYLLRRYDGDVVYALCAYETGMGAASRAKRHGVLPANLLYAERVLEARARLERSGCDGN